MSKIIHQIFLKITDKTIDDFPCYREGISLWKEFCEDNDWEYRLHTEIDDSIMTEEEKKVIKLGTERYPFYKIDFYRLILLSKFGGMYVDLDVFPTKNFNQIKDNEIIIGRSIDKGDNKFFVNNNILKLNQKLMNELKEYSILQTYEKLNIEVYKTWRIRFFLQTSSAQMLARFCKMNKLNYFDNYDNYFIDHNTQAWDHPDVL
tara:strand:+ start:89 stop:700 length:612 start_codon:yes stop_codon:yes gene_type:complete